MFCATGGIASRAVTEIIADIGSGLLLPDWRIYYLFEAGKSIQVLYTPDEHKIQTPEARKVKAHGGFIFKFLQ